MKHSPYTTQKPNTQHLALTGLMTAVLCVLGPLSFAVPFSPVPLSLTTLGICFASLVLGSKSGTLSVLLYLMLGFTGMPIFSGFMGGPAKIFGPTGGYILGYLFLALSCGYFVTRFKNSRILLFLGMCLGTAICYLFGTLWLAYQLSLSFDKALTIGVLPYLPWDVIKLLLALTLGTTLRKHLERANLIH